MRSLASVVRADTKRVTRDHFLLFMVGYPWLLALLLQKVLPWLDERFADRITLSNYSPIAACLVALLVPNAMGIVLGFQLVEEKDEGSLVAVAVTPMSLDQYFLYRTGVYALVSLPLVVVLHELLGVVRLPPGELILVALVSTPVVPLTALISRPSPETRSRGPQWPRVRVSSFSGPWPRSSSPVTGTCSWGSCRRTGPSRRTSLPWTVFLYRLFRRRAMAG